MMPAEFRSWQAVQSEVLRRIQSREWQPGQFIPGEAALAQEFNCARATVNRALRNLAESGLLDRKRKAGTQIALHPVRKATLLIPVLRAEIEGTGANYGYKLMEQAHCPPPPEIAARMRLTGPRKLLHLTALHLADGTPYVLEDRWIDTQAAPLAASADFAAISANEWLVANIPFEAGDISFTAAIAESTEAALLQCRTGDALFVIERTTSGRRGTITAVRLLFPPGYRMHTAL